jgi:hypothetical protein
VSGRIKRPTRDTNPHPHLMVVLFYSRESRELPELVVPLKKQGCSDATKKKSTTATKQ